MIDNHSGYAEVYEYDRFGRLYKTLSSHDTSDAHDYINQVTYDSVSRVKREYDAFTGVAGGNQSGVEKHYSRYGCLSHVVDIASNDEVYRVKGVNTRGQVTQARYGNGLTSQYHYETATGQLENQQVLDVVGAGSWSAYFSKW